MLTLPSIIDIKIMYTMLKITGWNIIKKSLLYNVINAMI